VRVEEDGEVNRIRQQKFNIAAGIITLSRQLGIYKPMTNGQYVDETLLANSHTLPELRTIYARMMTNGGQSYK